MTSSMGIAIIVDIHRASGRCRWTLFFEPASSKQPAYEMGQFATSLSDIAFVIALLFCAPRFLFTLLNSLVHNNSSTKRTKLMEVAVEPHTHKKGPAAD